MKLYAAIVVTTALSLQLPAPCVAGAFAGCYELRLSEWNPAISLGEDKKFVTPPARVELTTTPEQTWDKRGFRVTPAGGGTPSVHTFAYWTSDAHHVHIVWTNGHSGLTMDLEAQGSDLVGAAHTFWDFDRPQQTSDVVATKISCELKK
jgi:hypothetical protein